MIWETKTVRIESADVQWNGTPDSLEAIEEFIGNEDFYIYDTRSAIHLKVWNVLEDQWLNVPVGHWVVKGLKGEFYPCDPEAMDMKYAQVEPTLTVENLLKGLSALPDGYDDPRIDGACGILTKIISLAVCNDAVSMKQIEKIVADSTEFPEFWDEGRAW